MENQAVSTETIDKLKKIYKIISHPYPPKIILTQQQLTPLPSICTNNIYNIDQIPSLIEYINNKNKNNLCLHNMLEVVQYIESNEPLKFYYNTLNYILKYRGPKKDIYEKSMITINDKHIQHIQHYTEPNQLILDIVDKLNRNIQMFCFFTVYVQKNRINKIQNSHITLVIFKAIGTEWNVYKFNSGITSRKDDDILDSTIKDIIKFTHLQMNHYGLKPVSINFVPSKDWLPTKLQTRSNLCSLYTLDLYDYITSQPIHKIDINILNNLQIFKIGLKNYYMNISKNIKPLGTIQADFGP